MRFTVTVLLFLFVFGYSKSQNADSLSLQSLTEEELFEKGNQAFKDDQFKKAIHFYSVILERQYESAEVYFNLGNAYFKMNDIPHAILYFEKAKKIAPQDEDVRTNLELANLKTIDKVESKPELPFTNWWNQLLNSNEIDEWGKKSIYLSFIALFLLLLYIFLSGTAKKVFFFSGLFVVALSISFFLLGEFQKSRQINGKEAIIFSPNVTVKGSPEDDGTRLFVIHEGTKVKILSTFENWTEISLMNGNKGWIKSGDYQSI